MSLEVNTQNRVELIQEYSFKVGEEKWKIEYIKYILDATEDLPNFPDESLFIHSNYDAPKEEQDGDTIYLKEGNISSDFLEMVGESSMLHSFGKLEKGVKEEILEALSSEARSLLEKGLAKYDEGNN